VNGLDTIPLHVYLTAAARAVESLRGDRLFDDPYAEALACRIGFATKERIDIARRIRGVKPSFENPYAAMRTKFIDDYLVAQLAELPIRQVVIVAAGFDTRAFRLPFPDETTVFELDEANVFDVKRAVLAPLGAEPRCAYRAIVADVVSSWEQVLIAGGFERERPSAWIIEGALKYLERVVAESIIAQISSLATAGSSMLAEFVGQSLLESAWSLPLRKAMASEKAPWKFGTDYPDELLESFGWLPTLHYLGDADFNYGRWRFPPHGRRSAEYPNTYLVSATRI
jgi:methyltransferase (TIGR00027 family)